MRSSLWLRATGAPTATRKALGVELKDLLPPDDPHLQEEVGPSSPKITHRDGPAERTNPGLEPGAVPEDSVPDSLAPGLTCGIERQGERVAVRAIVWQADRSSAGAPLEAPPYPPEKWHRPPVRTTQRFDP